MNERKQSNKGKLNTSTIPLLNKGNLEEQMKQYVKGMPASAGG
jgi:hypothetical protein